VGSKGIAGNRVRSVWGHGSVASRGGGEQHCTKAHGDRCLLAWGSLRCLVLASAGAGECGCWPTQIQAPATPAVVCEACCHVVSTRCTGSTAVWSVRGDLCIKTIDMEVAGVDSQAPERVLQLANGET
jgi:hypothetical protein